MKKIAFFGLLLHLYSLIVSAQVSLPVYPDSAFSTYYQQRLTHFKTLPGGQGDILFLGNSITDGAEWAELFGDARVKNRGISGDLTAGVINRLEEVCRHQPAKIFLLIGINDLARHTSPDSVVKNILLIADYVRQECPATRLFVQSLLPVNGIYNKFPSHTDKSAPISLVNLALRQNAVVHHYTYLDIHDPFCDNQGKMKAELTNDGLHLKGEGYLLWKHLIFPYVFDLQPKPSLIPMPRQVKWEDGMFPAYECRGLRCQSRLLQNESRYLKEALDKKGVHVQINAPGDNGPVIELVLGKMPDSIRADEGYYLSVTRQKITLMGGSPHGLFNGIQTLLQLLRDNTLVDACEITDWPAFPWRGYMVDVARNFQSVRQLKQQIDKMACYKLDVLHLHLTEDIAWRLAIKQYPQLTQPQNMLRDEGGYYDETAIKELMAYCEARHIAFVPEIDMPGHSGAFRRCFHVSMQSDTGMAILKNILRSVLETYHFTYLHIGGDEVKITYPLFLADVAAFIRTYRTQTIGWSPGGVLPKETIHQLWSAREVLSDSMAYIDSRHLYLNHMDPLESVVTIFDRQLDNVQQGDASHLGAEICLWNDRAITREEDLLRMNPVFPAMLAFAERSWRGGGKPGWTATIGAPEGEIARAFGEFERRLLDQQRLAFQNLPFPYRKQADLVWNLYGPYPNGGDLTRSFAPEQVDEHKLPPTLHAAGGTIILRHWWYPQVQGVLTHPTENTTWYATTRIWSAEDRMGAFWIGFNNLSRSYATDPPPAGGWDDKFSAIWINGILVPPPLWKNAGKKGNLELPLADEGYEYRKPVLFPLKKGWNAIRIKLPVGGFTGKDWNNPVKWMFTFVPLNPSLKFCSTDGL